MSGRYNLITLVFTICLESNNLKIFYKTCVAFTEFFVCFLNKVAVLSRVPAHIPSLCDSVPGRLAVTPVMRCGALTKDFGSWAQLRPNHERAPAGQPVNSGQLWRADLGTGALSERKELGTVLTPASPVFGVSLESPGAWVFQWEEWRSEWRAPL